VATTDDENLKVIQKYCNNLYNRQNQATIDFTALQDIRQRPEEETEMGLTPTEEEVFQALQKMKIVDWQNGGEIHPDLASAPERLWCTKSNEIIEVKLGHVAICLI
jgi:hypothetical protein